MRVDSGAPTATTTHDGGVTEKRRSRTRSQSGSRSSGSGSGSASANGKTGEFASLPSPRSSPPSPPLFVVPISREDDVESCGVVEVAFSGGRRTWTIGDLKLALKPVTALGVHEQVILFADHQLTDGIKVSRATMKEEIFYCSNNFKPIVKLDGK
ncbi:hypothetical protein BCR33DRAFT_718422 [Rhizoclosmatium globosum]|uniref:Ubiquitin-like domain-containing protein n=1 Tax=Rhizoclosmatium globosum TaxID=329046 RepID=A0A1Y2C5L2_9FUNG|nr:hypothetical protein BCR33DRAFT_718422 [Rhizoclosmatium globosum]|eukprot:ORY42226.1 hypothetical protein BCR33DRAFT_718422 [Rhizoclosmatium globosum]